METRRHDVKTAKSVAAAERPQKVTFYFSRRAVQALMGEQLRRVGQGVARGDASLSALAEEAVLRRYDA